MSDPDGINMSDPDGINMSDPDGGATAQNVDTSARYARAPPTRRARRA